jgi:hypothetical protein
MRLCIDGVYCPSLQAKESMNNFLSTLKKRELRAFETAVAA